jgi:carotenoid cleavage dioxygenase-like enzyme
MSYLHDNFAPLETEHTCYDLSVEGDIPSELNGRYLRNGPNPIGPQPPTYHWFIGEGMVHGIRLRDGKAEWYRNRWVRTPDVRRALGEPAQPVILDETRLFSANTNIVAHAGRLFAVVEAGAVPVELDAELNTIAPTDFDGTLPAGFTPHPHRHPTTGDLHAVAYWWGAGNAVQHIVVDSVGKVASIRTVETPTADSPLMHDFALTNAKIVLFDLPCTFDINAVAPGMFPYRWNQAHGARVGITANDGRSSVTWIDIDPCFVFHVANAFDTDDGVVCDVIVHDSAFRIDVHGPNDGSTRLERWVIDVAAKTVTQSVIDNRPQEFPRVDERRGGMQHSIVYAATFTPSGPLLHGPLVRHDISSGTTTERDFGPGRGCLEPVFVPRHPTAAENDGWILTIVYDAGHHTSELQILDAGDPELPTLASVTLPTRIPYGFHGNWIPDTDLNPLAKARELGSHRYAVQPVGLG